MFILRFGCNSDAHTRILKVYSEHVNKYDKNENLLLARDREMRFMETVYSNI
jgi:hypothetical protein